jgi:hypothetical protein
MATGTRYHPKIIDQFIENRKFMLWPPNTRGDVGVMVMSIAGGPALTGSCHRFKDDDFAKIPKSALRFIPRHCDVP